MNRKVYLSVAATLLVLPLVACSSGQYEVMERTDKQAPNFEAPGTHPAVDYVLLHNGRKIYANCDTTTLDTIDPQATCGFRPLRSYPCSVGQDGDLLHAKLPLSDLKCLDADGHPVYLYVSKEEAAEGFPWALITALIALQFVAFGWRINREISVGDQDRKTWMPLPDYLNILSMIFVTSTCAAMPLAGYSYDALPRVALSIGYTLIAFHPISEAAHYGVLLPRKSGRELEQDGDYTWISRQEICTVTLSIVFSLIVGITALGK